MVAADSTGGTRWAGAAILGVAASAAALALTLEESLRVFNGALLVLPLMALIAEFLPVSLSSRGVRITFTLPYVAGMAVAAGPLAALLTDAVVSLVAGLWISRRAIARRAPFWMLVNLAVALLSCAVGSIALLYVRGLATGSTSREALEALAFMIGYGLLNFSVVALLEAAVTGNRYLHCVGTAMQVGVQSLALYMLLGVAVAVLVGQGILWALALTLVPVWALRTGLIFRARMEEHYYETITGLTLMLQRAHPYTHGHIERVAMSAEEVARKLGLSHSRARLVREAAVLHDIGKIAVDEEVLDKPSRLTTEEMEHVRRHSVCGAMILAPVRQFHEMLPWIRHHHERPDGTGYPDRLTDAEIPIESKIIAVVDAFDAMTGGPAPEHCRSYREPMTAVQAISELERCSGTQFDAKVVAAFKEVVLQGGV